MTITGYCIYFNANRDLPFIILYFGGFNEARKWYLLYVISSIPFDYVQFNSVHFILVQFISYSKDSDFDTIKWKIFSSKKLKIALEKRTSWKLVTMISLMISNL